MCGYDTIAALEAITLERGNVTRDCAKCDELEKGASIEFSWYLQKFVEVLHLVMLVVLKGVVRQGETGRALGNMVFFGQSCACWYRTRGQEERVNCTTCSCKVRGHCPRLLTKTSTQ